MKAMVALAATAIVLAVGAGSAPAQTPADRKIAALQRQTAALTKRVTALEKSLTQTRNLAAASLFYAQCLTAVTADAFVGTWNVVDQIAVATQAGKVYFGPQAAINDFTSCSANQITRQTTVPPSIAVFSALTTLIGE